MSKVVRKTSSRATIKTSTAPGSKILTTKTPHSIEELGDTNFGTLDESKDGQVVAYDAATDKFILITADNVFEESAADGDIPEVFIDQVEEEVDLGTIGLGEVDAGTW